MKLGAIIEESKLKNLMSKDNSKFFEHKSDWSRIKDTLLKCYLTPYLQKVLMTGQQICYIDCFAGKGRFDDGFPGSPLIALEIRDTCLRQSSISRKFDAIRMGFIELNHSQELERNIGNDYSNYGTPVVMAGKFEDLIFKCLQNKQGKNVFLYIDPYGIKALDMSLFQQFANMGFSTFEMLINFNSFGLFRNACVALNVNYKTDKTMPDLNDLVEYETTQADSTPQSIELINRIAGGDYWRNIVLDYKNGTINGYEAEQRLSNEYKQQLKKLFTYVLDMPIRLKEGQRPKYRMIHVCDHEDGCFLMAQNMQKRTKELYTNIQQKGQLDFFDLMDDMTTSSEGEYLTKSEISNMLRGTFEKYEDNGIRITQLLTHFVNDYGLICDFKFIYGILEDWEKSRYARLVRDPALTMKWQPSRFWEESKGHTLTIVRGSKA